jgi:hypothetical protein
MHGVECPQDRRQIVDGKDRQTGDVETLAALGALLLEVVEGLLELGQRAARLRQEIDAGARQRHLARRAREQLEPEVLLELAHAVADRRLRQVEMRRRPLEAAALGNAEKGLEAEKIDAHQKTHQRGRAPRLNEVHE